MRDHPGELWPRLPFGENGVKILFKRGCSFHSDPPFLFGEGLLSDGIPEACSREQLPDCLVVVAALQAADEVGCRPRLEPVEPLPGSGHIKRVRNKVLTTAGRPRRPSDLHGNPVQHEGRSQKPNSLFVRHGNGHELKDAGIGH